jgi:hypothetical protein
MLGALLASSLSMATAEFLSKHHENYFRREGVARAEIYPFLLKGLQILQ